jgi:hypothetical protein
LLRLSDRERKVASAVGSRYQSAGEETADPMACCSDVWAVQNPEILGLIKTINTTVQ